MPFAKRELKNQLPQSNYKNNGYSSSQQKIKLSEEPN